MHKQPTETLSIVGLPYISVAQVICYRYSNDTFFWFYSSLFRTSYIFRPVSCSDNDSFIIDYNLIVVYEHKSCIVSGCNVFSKSMLFHVFLQCCHYLLFTVDTNYHTTNYV